MFFFVLFQPAEAKFKIRQSEVSTAGLFSDIDLFKEQVGPTARPSEHDKWVESTAALTKAVAACTKAATQKPAPKKQASTAKASTTPKKSAKPANAPGGGKKRGTRGKSKNKKATKASTSAADKADTAKKTADTKTSD